MRAERNIIETLTALDNFSLFSVLLDRSLLAQTLRSESGLTLFAPMDLAFTTLSGVTLPWLVEEQNESRLADIVNYHLVRGTLTSKQLEQIATAQTEQGQEIRIDVRDSILVDSAKVLRSDIYASNGIIHGIDSLLIPTAAFTAR